ncbi:parallel beta-helix repeat protein [Geothermobacter ehrlichii]|uniref:Parallel beta-helix repeat protein n=1 Tax=Geothermobacter ehrlichii TaxID=213224 RepID=A0A5D3WIU7_9BACT|nr:NosD domain-containing protein [Geothermobacter ehrlichii]TYO97119.1 parallel beta-helix repeat protein [Geothermobacter ehrlichii]
MFSRFLPASVFGLWLVLLAGPALALCYSGTLLGHSRWEGEVDLTGPVIVPADASLTIVAGTRVRVKEKTFKLTVRGRLRIEGSADEPVVFEAPAGWQGIELMETTGRSLIRQARFRGANQAIGSYGSDFEVVDSEFVDCDFGVHLLRESPPLIRGNRFVGGRVGVAVEMKSSPTIADNHFENLRETGIFASHSSRGTVTGNRFVGNGRGITLQQPYPDRIENNLFTGNDVGLFCNQTRNTPRIIGNRFEKNGKALVNYAFSYPLIRNNVFVDNGTAIRNDQFGSPQIEHNLLRGNDTAIYNYRKSNPQVENNQIEQNGLAIFCDYSSYPQVRNNNFIDNREAVRLGIYQSADWEKRSGSRALVMRQARARGSRNELLAQAPTRFVDRVDVSGNWWGKDSERLAAATEESNDPLFWDRHDQPTVVYEGFGDEAYALDRVVFSPVLQMPVDQAGPQAGP